MFKVIQSYSSRIEANIAKGLLESNGIIAQISADDAGGAYPFPFTITVGVKLQVECKDLQKAKKILKSEVIKTS
jgi:hypothetical protein